MRTVERGDAVGAAGSALGLGLGVASKYSAAFLAPLIGIAELLSPFGPRALTPIRPWIRVAVRTALTGLAGVAIFLLLDPLVVRYFDKFQSDIKIWVIDPLSGTSKPEWIAQFADVNAMPYWFTNLLWWGLGPALEIWAIAGVAVAARGGAIGCRSCQRLFRSSTGSRRARPPRSRRSSATRFRSLRRWPSLPPRSALTCLRRPRWRPPECRRHGRRRRRRRWCGPLAYMNVFRQPDSRLAASAVAARERARRIRRFSSSRRTTCRRWART